MAIIEWTLKQVAIQAALKQDEWRSVCGIVLDTRDRDAIQIAWDTSRHWVTSTPKKAWRDKFLAPMLASLKVEGSVTIDMLIKLDVDSFVALLPIDLRDDAKQAVSLERNGPSGLPAHTEGQCVEPCTHYPISSSSRSTLMAGVEAGIVDPHTYYSSAEGAEIWSQIVNAHDYPTYFYCKESLAALLKDGKWRDAFASSRPTTTFMLGGGGSPAKDLLLLRAMLADRSLGDQRLTMVLVDINPHMLEQSREILAQWMRDEPGRERVLIRSLKDDILDLSRQDPVRERILSRSGAAVFAITGNTIGNVSELGVFSMLGRVARTGDLLVVGCGTMDDMTHEQVLLDEEGKYKAPEVLRFIRPGVECAIRQWRLQESLDGAFKRVRVEVRPGTQGLSDVPDSASVVLTMQAGQRNIVLLRSARYISRSFIAFAQGHGWDCISESPSPMSRHYVQFAFRKR